MKYLSKITNIYLIFFFLIFFTNSLSLRAESPKFPFLVTPITSSPVSLALGGASIANNNDPSAAIFNPANIVLFSNPQWTISTYNSVKKEIAEINDDHYSVSGTQNVKSFHIGYCGLSFPFKILSKKMVAGISYHPGFSFERSLTLNQNDDQEMTDQRIWSLKQSGYMSALSLSYGIEVSNSFYLGMNLNFWRDDVLDNQWKQDISMRGYRQNGNVRFEEFQKTSVSFDDKGTNLDFGILWKISSKLIAGAVIQTNRSNDITTKSSEKYIFENTAVDPAFNPADSIISLNDIQIPMTIGMGMSYFINENWNLLLDFRQIFWEQFKYTTDDESSRQFISGREEDTEKDLRVHIINFGTIYRLKTRSIKAFDLIFRMGFSACTDRGIVHPEPDSSVGFGFGLEGKKMDLNFGYQYQRYTNQEQLILSESELKNSIRINVMEASLTYKFY